MELKSFNDYFIERQIREDEEKIKVDPAQRIASRQAQTAVARTLKGSELDLKDVDTDPGTKNRLLGTALAKAQGAGARGVTIKTIATTIDPQMKI